MSAAKVVRFGAVRFDGGDSTLTDLVTQYMGTLAKLDALPASRQRSLAITALEESFSHAIFAAANIDSPIRMG